MYKAYVEKRSQKRVGSPPKAGPDTYFAVQVVPRFERKLTSLNSNVAAQRGIEIIYCGQGYSNRTTSPTSMYNVAQSEAIRIADRINETGEYNGY